MTPIPADKAAIAEADDATRQAQGRVAAIERGEIVEGGLGKPQDWRELSKAAGWTEADLRHARLLASIPIERFDEFLRLAADLSSKARRSLLTKAALEILRKHGRE